MYTYAVTVSQVCRRHMRTRLNRALAMLAKMASVTEYFSFGNILLVILMAFMAYQMIELYQFRDMPPGPRFTNLPLIGNLFSFNFDGEIFQDVVAR